MRDTVETIGSSLVQHGPGHDRAHLKKLHPADADGIVEKLEHLACSRGYSKLSATVAAGETGRFVAAGYHIEALLPDFFPQGGAACFMARFLNGERRLERQPQLVREVLAAASAQRDDGPSTLPPGFALGRGTPAHAEELALLHRELYPGMESAMHDPQRVRSLMGGDRIFLCVWQGESLVAVASAEVDACSSSAEVAEIAVLPEYRPDGIALYLLQRLEETLLALGVRSAFTIARANSFPVNITWARNGYSFAGTLTNHGNSYGPLESANVWHKVLPEDTKVAWSFLRGGAASSANSGADGIL